MFSFLRSSHFWVPFVISTLLFGVFLGWELNLFAPTFPNLPRPEVTVVEIIFTILLILFLALNTGLFFFQRKDGSCPVGTRRATGTSGVIGAIILICPVCVLLPISILGLSFTLTFLIPFLPLLRVITLILLGVSTWMLLRKN